jgi:hypothetical protein
VGENMVMTVLALLVFIPTWWAMRVKLAGSGQAGLACHARAGTFAVFQLAVMLGLVVLDAWWGILFYVFLMLATGHMVLEAAAQAYPASRLGAWWARQKEASAARRK